MYFCTKKWFIPLARHFLFKSRLKLRFFFPFVHSFITLCVIFNHEDTWLNKKKFKSKFARGMNKLYAVDIELLVLKTPFLNMFPAAREAHWNPNYWNKNPKWSVQVPVNFSSTNYLKKKERKSKNPFVKSVLSAWCVCSPKQMERHKAENANT